MLQERIKQVFHQRKAIAVGSFVFSFALSLSFVLGIQLKYIGYTWGGVKGKIAIIAVSVILSVIIEPFIYMFTECIEKLKFKKQNLEAGGNRVFFICFIGIFVSWVPHYLAFWPAIMSYDFNAQYVSARSGLDAFTTHHPLMHTFLIRQFLLLGDLLGSPEIGMSLFALTQMVILASIMACSCQLIARITGSNKWGFIGAAFFAIFPTHPIMSVCMTKDVLFSAFFLLFTISMIKLSFCDTGKNNSKKIIFCIIAGVLTMLFRNNALYAFVVFSPIYVLLSGKKWIRSLVVSLSIIALSLVLLSGSKAIFKAGSGSEIEKYSVVLQTFARTGLNHGETLSQKEYEIIDYYVPAELWSSYNPGIADNIKVCVADTFSRWENDKIKLFRDWIYIGLRYPNDYLDAILTLTCGYWSIPDETHTNVWGNGMETGTGLISTFNASSTEKFEFIDEVSYISWLKTLDKKLVNDDVYLKVPVISILFKPAFYCWVLIYVLISSICLKKKKACMVALWPILYLCTLLLGPVVNYRYVYPLLISLPIMCAYFLHDESCGKLVGK